MVRINRITQGVIKADVLVKVETFNPGNSIKDRMAVKMIEDAERAGAAQAWRDHHRRDVGQHRDGVGDCGSREGLQVHFHDDRQAVEGESRRVEGVWGGSHRLPDERRSRGPSFVLLGVLAPGQRSAERLEGQSVPTTSPTHRRITSRPHRRSGSRPAARSTTWSSAWAPEGRSAASGAT